MCYRYIGSDEAIADGIKALRVCPKSSQDYANCYLNLSHLYENRGAVDEANKKYEEAISDYTQAIQYNIIVRRNAPKSFASITALTEVLPYKQRYKQLWWLIRDRGFCYAHYKNYDKAIIDFTKSIRYYPRGGGPFERGDLLQWQGSAYTMKGDMKKAQADRAEYTRLMNLVKEH